MDSTERKKRKKERIQGLFIDAAETRFLESGYEQVSVEAIAEDIGYTKRTFYVYFKDKEEIFAAVTFRTLSALFQQLLLAASSKETGLDKLTSIGYAYYKYMKAFPYHFGLNQMFELKNYANDQLSKIDKEREFTCACVQKDKEITVLVKEIIALGREDGSIDSSQSDDGLLLFMFGTTFGMLQALKHQEKYIGTGKEAQKDDFFKDFIQLIIQSVSK